MLQSRGLRVSLGGAVLFIAGLIMLPFLPNAVPLLAVGVGGLIVWSGFIWTLMKYYLPGSSNVDDVVSPRDRR